MQTKATLLHLELAESIPDQPEIIAKVREAMDTIIIQYDAEINSLNKLVGEYKKLTDELRKEIKTLTEAVVGGWKL